MTRRLHLPAGIDVVVGIGGGSALDAAKAIAGLLPHGHSVMRHLEGVGPEEAVFRPSTPLILVPTTAGTGSKPPRTPCSAGMAPGGFKKSFRDEELVARVAIRRSRTAGRSCPPEVVAANGMDAFTQLLESVSLKANPLTDALAWSGIEAFHDGFFAAWRGGADEEARAGRSRMAYAALLSGNLPGADRPRLGARSASPLGASFPIPHGVCCGTLVAEATRINVRALRERAPTHAALAKYAAVGELLAGERSAATRTALTAWWTCCANGPSGSDCRAFPHTACQRTMPH